MNSESKPRSSTARAKSFMPRARSGPSPSQMYEGRKTPNRPISLTGDTSRCSASSAVVFGWSLGDEGPGAFEQVVGGEDPDRSLRLRRVAGRQVAVERLIDEP